MRTVSMQVSVPEDMAPYLTDPDSRRAFEMGAMLLYPYVRDLTISHGRAAEILGVHKTDLIEFYGSIGIPYLDQSEDELIADLQTLEGVLGAPR